MLGDHLELFRCSSCRGELTPSKERVRCVDCGTIFGTNAGFIDFAPEIPSRSADRQPSRGQRWMEDPAKVRSYESTQRVHYVRTMGKTWFKSFTPEIEDAYLIEYVEPTSDGVVLDVACGAGRWTHVLVERFRPERVIGLDLSYAMLTAARRLLPSTTLVRGSATSLPFADNSLGAVNCWNAIQALPDPQRAIVDMARILQPGGTFTCLTYLKSTGPYRWVQSFLQRQVGSIVVEHDEFLRWIDSAGLTIEDETLMGQVVMLSARRR